MPPMLDPIIVHQSDLQSWNRCPQEFRFDRIGDARKGQNSATAFGSVLHHAMHILEREKDLDVAIKTFLFYWHPMNTEAICPPIPSGGWLPMHSYGELRKRGVDTLRKYADVLRHDDHELLALEFEFVVPLHMMVNGREVFLAGTADRLAARWYRQRETLCVDDFKTGQQKWNLRHNVQGSAYAYASLQPEFWLGNTVEGYRLLGEKPITYISPGFSEQEALDDRFAHRGAELNERFSPDIARRFTWINLKSFKWVDGGFRGPQDFDRLRKAAEQLILSCDAGIFPLRIDGETCKFCAFKDVCPDGTGLPDDTHGDPAYAVRVIE